VCAEDANGMDIREECKDEGASSFDGLLWSLQEANVGCPDQDNIGEALTVCSPDCRLLVVYV